MVDTVTTNYSFTKPEIGASENTWGEKTNLNWDAVDTALKVHADAITALEALPNTAAEYLTALLTVDGPGSLLNADLLDGQEGAYYLPAASYTAADVLAKLLTVDGALSLLDADKLDGHEAADFLLLADYDGGVLDAKVLALAAVTGAAANRLAYFTSSTAMATTDISALARTLLGFNTDAEWLAELGVGSASSSTRSITVAGLTIKWGTAAVGANVFPSDFATGCDAVLISHSNNPVADADEADEYWYVGTKSASGFTITAVGDGGTGATFFYVALGS